MLKLIIFFQFKVNGSYINNSFELFFKKIRFYICIILRVQTTSLQLGRSQALSAAELLCKDPKSGGDL